MSAFTRVQVLAISIVILGTVAYLGTSDHKSTSQISSVDNGNTFHKRYECMQPANSNAPIIRVGMSAAFVSEKGVGIYKEITDYLTCESKLNCEFVTGLSYATLNDMLDDGALQVAFVCGLPYVLQQEMDNPPTRLLAAPIMKAAQYQGVPKYFSYTIVRKESNYHSFDDLKGCVYTYNDELSNSGYNLPRARLIELGQTQGFFSKVLRSGSHEESIRMVAEGKADASSVDSLVYDYDLAKHPEFASRVRIIDQLGPAGICPIVASTTLSDQHFKILKSVLLNMNQSELGKNILERALVDRFVEVSDENYSDIRKYLERARHANFMELK